MRVTVLGCGGSAGVPQIGGADGRGDWGACDPAEPRNRRSRASVVVEHQGRRILVDTAPEMRSQLIASGVPDVAAIFFTHAHADHITGLDDVRILNRLIGQPLEAYGTQPTLDELERRFDYAFLPHETPYFYRPVLVKRPVSAGETVVAAGASVRLFEQDHGTTTTLGMRIGGFGYSTDAVGLDEAAFAALEGVDTWVVGCFQRAPHRTHAGLDQALAWATRLGARRTVLTHMGTDLDWAWLQANLPDGVEPAYDGMVLDVPNGL